MAKPNEEYLWVRFVHWVHMVYFYYIISISFLCLKETNCWGLVIIITFKAQSHIPSWPQSHCVADAGLELLIIPLSVPGYYRLSHCAGFDFACFGTFSNR